MFLAVILIKHVMEKLNLYILNILKSKQNELRVALSYIYFTFSQNGLQLEYFLLVNKEN